MSDPPKHTRLGRNQRCTRFLILDRERLGKPDQPVETSFTTLCMTDFLTQRLIDAGNQFDVLVVEAERIIAKYVHPEGIIGRHLTAA